MDGDVVFTRDKSSGRIHKRVRLGDGLATFEGDNLDEAGLYEILVTLADSDPDDLCRRCFGETVIQGEAQSVTR